MRLINFNCGRLTSKKTEHIKEGKEQKQAFKRTRAEFTTVRDALVINPPNSSVKRVKHGRLTPRKTPTTLYMIEEQREKGSKTKV